MAKIQISETSRGQSSLPLMCTQSAGVPGGGGAASRGASVVSVGRTSPRVTYNMFLFMHLSNVKTR